MGGRRKGGRKEVLVRSSSRGVGGGGGGSARRAAIDRTFQVSGQFCNIPRPQIEKQVVKRQFFEGRKEGKFDIGGSFKEPIG